MHLSHFDKMISMHTDYSFTQFSQAPATCKCQMMLCAMHTLLVSIVYWLLLANCIATSHPLSTTCLY